MARTEKKFGQVAKVPGGTTVTELVPVSANRRNILLNMTATAADSVTAFVSNGNLTTTQSGAATSIMSTTQSNFLSGSLTGSNIEYQSYNSNMYHAATMNVSKTRVIGTPDGPGNRTFFANVSSTGVISSNGAPSISGGSYDNQVYNNGYYSTFAPIATNPVVSWGTGANEATIFFMGLPRQGIGYGSSYSQWFVVYGTGGNIQNASQNYPYINSAQVSNYSYCYGALNIKHTINNLLLVGGCGPSYGNAPELEIGEIGATGSPIAYAYSNRTQTQLNQDANEGVWSMFPLDFNSSTSQFAVSTPTTNTQNIRGVAIANSVSLAGVTFPNWPVGANASAGFRIVDQAASGSTILSRLLGGTIVYPPAPTGVNVPNIGRPIKGLKFSPDGNKLAVFYNRQYAGSGDTNSVLVIYTKGAGNTWTHTWSSGAQLPRTIPYADSFDWSADSSMICMVGDDDVARMVSFGYPASTANNVITISGTSPTLNAGSIASPVNHVNGVFTNSISSVSAVRQVINMPTSDNTNRFVIFKKQNQVYLSTPNGTGQAISMVTGQTTGSGTVNNYVGTIAQEVPLAVGGVTQISGVVLEPGEKVSIQATTGSRADVAAYGVEIS
jgi:hypothetical protein